jgi:hypothetical protein
METESAKRFSIFLSESQELEIRSIFLETIKDTVHFEPASKMKTSDFLINIFELYGMSKRYVKPKSERNQGRKKRNNNIQQNSEQDMFRVNLNSLAPCVGVNSDAE